MTNQLPNDLSHLSEEEFHSLCPQGEHAPGPEPLSPAAQAVLEIINAAPHCGSGRIKAAAALRAAVVQVAPVSTNARQMKIRDELLAIAAELEGIS
jgi:hypothetical protein